MKPEKTEYGTYVKEIEDAAGNLRKFEYEKWGAEKSTDTLIDLVGICGEAYGSLQDIFLKAKGDMDYMVADNAIAGLFRSLTQNLSRDKTLTKGLIRMLSSEKVLVDGASIKYDSFYQDDLALSFAAAYGNIEVQYGNFFAAAARFMPKRPAAAQVTSPQK